VTVADVNRDGRPDIVTGNSRYGFVNVLLGNGNGTFQANQAYAVNGAAPSVAVGDLNHDGAMEVVAGNGTFSSVNVLPGKIVTSAQRVIEAFGSPGFFLSSTGGPVSLARDDGSAAFRA